MGAGQVAAAGEVDGQERQFVHYYYPGNYLGVLRWRLPDYVL